VKSATGECIHLENINLFDHNKNPTHSDKKVSNQRAFFKCKDDSLIAHDKLDDLVPDCYNGEDEELYKSVLTGSYSTENITLSCSDINYISCMYGVPRCFPKDRVCVLDHSDDGSLSHCRNGMHLIYCEYFDCPGMFKCPEMYCLPLHRVCNGVSDCMWGEDEVECNIPLSCPGHLRCKAGFCVSSDYVCDGVSQCPGQDDELFCNIRHCPNGCSCMQSSFNCTNARLQQLPMQSPEIISFIGNYNKLNVTLNMLHRFEKLIRLEMRGNKLVELPYNTTGAFHTMANLHLLDLRNNLLCSLYAGTFKGLSKLTVLLLGNNPLQVLRNHAFSGLRSIKILKLNNLLLYKIEEFAFSDLQSLNELYLSSNRLSTISASTLEMLNSLTILDLRQNDVKVISLSSLPLFDHLTYIGGDHWSFCCLAQTVSKCTAPVSFVSSCTDLLGQPFLKVSIWFILLGSFMANGFVIFYRSFILNKKMSPHNILLVNLALSDILMSVYLLGLATADVIYMGSYAINDNTWRESLYCKALSILSNVSGEVSLSFISFLSYFFAKTIQSFHIRRYSKRILCFCLTLWSIILIMSSTIIFLMTKLSSGSCLFYNFQISESVIEMIIKITYILLNWILILVAVYFSCKMIHHIKHSLKTLRVSGSVSSSSSSGKTYQKIVLLILTNLACWIPIQILMIMSLCGFSIRSGVSNWFAVVVVPFNSLTNPFLYTIGSLWKKKKQHIHGYIGVKQNLQGGELTSNLQITNSQE